jgi:hypothetical protein
MNLLIELFDTTPIKIDVTHDYRIFLTFDFNNKILIFVNNIDIDSHEIECSVVFYIDTSQINTDEFHASKYISINIATSNFTYDSNLITLNFFDHIIEFKFQHVQKKLFELNYNTSMYLPRLYAQPTCLH